MHAAHFAERVLRNLGVELIGGQVVLAADQLELLGWHYEVQEALLAAQRAIAIGDAVEVRCNAETHPAAVTTAFVGRWHQTRILRFSPCLTLPHLE
jgi:hypothetical protein